MALIDCSECDGHVSDGALSCPSCGAPTGTDTERGTSIGVFALVAVNVLLGGWLVIALSSATPPSAAVDAQPLHIDTAAAPVEVDTVSTAAQEPPASASRGGWRSRVSRGASYRRKGDIRDIFCRVAEGETEEEYRARAPQHCHQR